MNSSPLSYETRNYALDVEDPSGSWSEALKFVIQTEGKYLILLSTICTPNPITTSDNRVLEIHSFRSDRDRNGPWWLNSRVPMSRWINAQKSGPHCSSLLIWALWERGQTELLWDSLKNKFLWADETKIELFGLEETRHDTRPRMIVFLMVSPVCTIGK